MENDSHKKSEQFCKICFVGNNYGCYNINFDGNFSFINEIGSINENRDIEQRIAITPEVIKKYKSIGLEVCLSKNYGVHLGINDKVYENEGAVILKSEEEVISVSSAILQMNILNDTDLNKLNKSQILIGF